MLLSFIGISFQLLYLLLAVDGNRTFVYVETAYIAKWWAEATPAQQAAFTKFITNGQIELVSGGASRIFPFSSPVCDLMSMVTDVRSAKAG